MRSGVGQVGIPRRDLSVTSADSLCQLDRGGSLYGSVYLDGSEIPEWGWGVVTKLCVPRGANLKPGDPLCEFRELSEDEAVIKQRHMIEIWGDPLDTIDSLEQRSPATGVARTQIRAARLALSKKGWWGRIVRIFERSIFLYSIHRPLSDWLDQTTSNSTASRLAQ